MGDLRMTETMRWPEVAHVTQLTHEGVVLLETYAAFPRRTCGAMGMRCWPRAEVETWLRNHPVTIDSDLEHELKLCEGHLGRGDNRSARHDQS